MSKLMNRSKNISTKLLCVVFTVVLSGCFVLLFSTFSNAEENNIVTDKTCEPAVTDPATNKDNNDVLSNEDNNNEISISDTIANEKTAYACVEKFNIEEEEYEKLIFYYDSSRTIRESEGKTCYDLNSGEESPKWYMSHNLCHFKFDESFVSYKPISCRSWFHCGNYNHDLYIENINYLDTSNVVDMNAMFYGRKNLTSLDLSGFNTSNVANMCSMFSGTGFETLDLFNFDTSKVTNMSHMFDGCNKLVSLNIANFNTGNLKEAILMFDDCRKLENIELMSFSPNSDCDIWGMFRQCESIQYLDLANFDTSNVVDMHELFCECYNLKEVNLSSFNTSKISSLTYFFMECRSLERVDLSSFDTRKVDNMAAMFGNCWKLESVNLDKLETSNVNNMQGMFLNCEKLQTVNLDKFDTYKVTTYEGMFYGCSSLQYLELPRFYMRTGGYNIKGMFQNCTNLKTILVELDPDWSIEWNCSSENMFSGCTSLVGGSGTAYDSSAVDKSRARVDGLLGKKGYFTQNTTYTSGRFPVFKAESETQRDIPLSIIFNDGLFNKSSVNYDSKIAIGSIVLSRQVECGLDAGMEAFAKLGFRFLDQDYFDSHSITQPAYIIGYRIVGNDVIICTLLEISNAKWKVKCTKEL